MSARSEHGDKLLAAIVHSYSDDGVVNTWDNSWMPERLVSSDSVVSVSASERMAEILAVLTRDRLDAGGWSNPYAPAPGYAADYALLQVPVGEGAVSAR